MSVSAPLPLGSPFSPDGGLPLPERAPVRPEPGHVETGGPGARGPGATGVESAAAALPSPFAFVRSLVGFGLLGLVAALGGDAHGAPVGLVSTAGALVLTVPALLVAHPFLSLRAAPQALVAAIARPFTRVGDLALGLVPSLLLFRATSGLAPALLCLMLLGLAFLGFSLAVRHLVAAERAANPELWGVGKMAALAWAWSGLAFLIGARLGVGVLLG